MDKYALLKFYSQGNTTEYKESNAMSIVMTSSNGTIFHVTGHLCGEFPAHRPVTRSFDVSFDLHLNTRLSKQSRGWWFETPPSSLWRHRNDVVGTWLTTSVWLLRWSKPGLCIVSGYIYIIYWISFMLYIKTHRNSLVRVSAKIPKSLLRNIVLHEFSTGSKTTATKQA